jgi:hypothetical protein
MDKLIDLSGSLAYDFRIGNWLGAIGVCEQRDR